MRFLHFGRQVVKDRIECGQFLEWIFEGCAKNAIGHHVDVEAIKLRELPVQTQVEAARTERVRVN